MSEHNLVAFALKERGSPYIYGATGRRCVPCYRKELMAQYPQFAAQIRDNCCVLSGDTLTCAGCMYQGRRAYDCAQFVRRALEACGVPLPSGASSQWLKGQWAVQGALPCPAKCVSPEHPVMKYPCVLFRADPFGPKDRPMAHVGLSLGDGRAADARSHARGVVLGDLGSYPWTHFAVPFGFAWTGDENAAAAGSPPPGTGSNPQFTAFAAFGQRGEAVKRLQRALTALGYPLPRYGIDGIFGSETQAALDALRKGAGIAETGPCSWETLQAMEKRAQERMNNG